MNESLKRVLFKARKEILDWRVWIGLCLSLPLIGYGLWGLAVSLHPDSRSSASSSESEPEKTPNWDRASPAERLSRSKKRLEPFGDLRMVDPPSLTNDLFGSYLQKAVSDLEGIPPSAPEYREARTFLALVKETQKRRADAFVLEYGGSFIQSYQELLSNAFPSLNHIDVQLQRDSLGYSLYGVHSYFGRYTFEIGPAARLVSGWIAENHDKLKEAGIVRVGVEDREGYFGGSWFQVK